MTPKTIVGSRKLGEKIRARWLELDLTIEEVALRAGGLTGRDRHKTWPEFLKERFGTQAAETFAMGSWRYLDSRSFFQSRF